MIFEDESLRIDLVHPPAAKGHVQITAKQQNLEDFFFAASYTATALFELIKAQGSNVIATLSEQGAVADIIARTENDGLNFMWEPKQGNPEELAKLAKQLKDDIDVQIYHEEEAKKNDPQPQQQSPSSPQPVKGSTQQPNSKGGSYLQPEPRVLSSKEKTNYLVDSQKRQP